MVGNLHVGLQVILVPAPVRPSRAETGPSVDILLAHLSALAPHLAHLVALWAVLLNKRARRNLSNLIVQLQKMEAPRLHRHVRETEEETTVSFVTTIFLDMVIYKDQDVPMKLATKP